MANLIGKTANLNIPRKCLTWKKMQTFLQLYNYNTITVMCQTVPDVIFSSLVEKFRKSCCAAPRVSIGVSVGVCISKMFKVLI